MTVEVATFLNNAPILVGIVAGVVCGALFGFASGGVLGAILDAIIGGVIGFGVGFVWSMLPLAVTASLKLTSPMYAGVVTVVIYGVARILAS